jgi:hypothetical protein
MLGANASAALGAVFAVLKSFYRSAVFVLMQQFSFLYYCVNISDVFSLEQWR